MVTKTIGAWKIDIKGTVVHLTAPDGMVAKVELKTRILDTILFEKPVSYINQQGAYSYKDIKIPKFLPFNVRDYLLKLKKLMLLA